VEHGLSRLRKQYTENVYAALFTKYYDDQINTDKMASAGKEKEILTKYLVLKLNGRGLLENVGLYIDEDNIKITLNK
jgi:hypothetical protein